MHLMIWAAIGSALLQGVADMDDVCNVISDILESMFNATLPRNIMSKTLLKRHCNLILWRQELLKKLRQEDELC